MTCACRPLRDGAGQAALFSTEQAWHLECICNKYRTWDMVLLVSAVRDGRSMQNCLRVAFTFVHVHGISGPHPKARHAPSTPSGQRVEGPPQITEIPCHHGWVSMSSTQTGIGVAPVPRHKSVTCGLADHAPDEFHLVCGSLSSSVNMFSSMVHSSKSASLLRLSSSVQRARALQIVAQLP